MGKEDQQILVVRRGALFGENEFQGFLAAHERDFISTINESYEFMRRGDVEEDRSIQQPIPYVWIVNPATKEVFVYTRSGKKGDYSEARLMNKVSCGVGGHIEQCDEKDPIYGAMMRELMEEIKTAEYPEPRIVGYINDDSTPVNSVHFGLVAIAETTLAVEKGDDEMSEGRFVSVGELERMFEDPANDIEPWTRISWPHVRDYIASLS